MKKFIGWKILAIFAFTLFLGYFDMPNSPLSQNNVMLGLDLNGGAQLDYRVDLRKVQESDHNNIVEAVRNTIERRVNSLGIAEPNIYISEIGDEQHIIVELAQTAEISQDDVDQYIGEGKSILDLTLDERQEVSLAKAKDKVGDVIQLEFKELGEGNQSEAELEEVRQNAQTALDRIKGGAEYEIVAQEEEQAYPSKVRFFESEFLFEDEIPTAIFEAIQNLQPGQITESIVETGGTITINAAGEAIEQTGLAILKLTEKKEEIRYEKSVSTSHILVSYLNADEAAAGITRSQEEAKALADEVKVKLDAGEDFNTLVQEFSDDASTKENNGLRETPVTGEGDYLFNYEQAALELAAAGNVSAVIETSKGYHIIKANEITENVTETKYKFSELNYSTIPDPWQETGLTGKNFLRAEVLFDEFLQPLIQIEFDAEGADMFEAITARNIGRPVAIFVGGELVSSPNVETTINTGTAFITGQFTQEEATTLANDLNNGAIEAPITLTGERTIGATLGRQALETSLYAGAAGLLIVMLFMIAYYRIPGLVATFALSSYAIILIALIKSQLSTPIAILLALFIFAAMVFKVLQSKESGPDKFFSFVLSCAAFFFFIYILQSPITLTLAGVAGIILSIGMAVDANILIFERFKEELRSGKTFNKAIDEGFSRAWTAIRDSNFSTLLICVILHQFGGTLIRGFAFNLAAGVLVSMFTAIVITQTLLKGFVGRKIAKNLKLFGHTEKAPKKRNFLKFAKIPMALSGLAVSASIILIFAFGLNLGIDFRSGTLMEFQFDSPIEKAQLEQVINESAPEGIDLSSSKVLPSGDQGFVVKTEYLTSEQHEQLIAKAKESLPTFTEPQFTTISPTIGAAMLQSALWAIAIALGVIILYIGFAFRKIPKSINRWRFGACAIIALLHDVLIITGIFVVLGQVLSVEIDALFITAMLTVFGYSVNDTIVIFDRIRENILKDTGESLQEVTNKSLSQTLARSINTSLSTLITLVAVLIWGSPSIFYFILALTIGTAIGTYSSLLIASPILVRWATKKK